MESFIYYIIIAALLTQLYLLGDILNKLKLNNKLIHIIIKISYYISLPFRLVNTLIHELGHVFMSIMTKGKVYKIKLFTNASGEAETGSTKWSAKVLTSLAGYPFASIVALFFIFLLSQGYKEIIVYFLIAFLLGSLFFVRNVFGFVWTVLFLGLTLIINSYGSTQFILGFLMFIVAVLLVESVCSALYILYLSITNSKESGDCSNLSNFTKLPAFTYGIIFASQALIFGYYGLTLIF